ncbi:MAG: hypothetical protein WDN49_17745 [Acetobacteraceae bacterium]
MLDADQDVSDAAFPFMAAAELRGFGGLPARGVPHLVLRQLGL